MQNEHFFLTNTSLCLRQLSKMQPASFSFFESWEKNQIFLQKNLEM
jgi:hypothetical protein